MNDKIIQKSTKRWEIINEAINSYKEKKYELVINSLENFEKELKPWDDPYLLGYSYALLCNSYLESTFYNEEKIISYANKILLVSGQSLFEYTGNYSLFTHGNIEKLFDVYDKLIEKKNEDSFWGKARLLAFQNKYNEAEILLKEGVSINSKNVYTYLMYGRLLEFQYKYDEAIEQFQEAIEQCSNNELSLTYQMLAYIYQKKADYFKAEELFKKAIEVDSKDSRAPLRLSFLYYFLENEKWKESINKAVELSPDNSKIITAKADFIIDTDFTEGMKLYDEAILINPLCNMAIRNKSLRINKKAIWNNLYKKCIRQNRFDTLSYVYYIRKLYDEDKYDDRKKIITRNHCSFIINRIFTRYCPFAVYEINYLKLYIKLKDFDFFNKATLLISENQYNIDLYLLLADSYKENQDLENAKVYLQKAAFIDKFNSNILFELGYIEQQSRNYSASIEYFTKSLNLFNSTKTKVNLLISKCYFEESIKSIDKNNIEEEISSILMEKRFISNWDYLCLGELAYRFDLSDTSLLVLNKIDKESFEYPLATLIQCGVYKKKNDHINFEKSIQEFNKQKCYVYFNSLSELIDMFRDEIDISVFKQLFVENKDFTDSDFETILESEALRKDKDLRELWLWISTIRSLLCYKKYNTTGTTISHYTGTDTLDAICLYTTNESNPLNNPKENFGGKIRLSTITPANDPEEGNVLSKILNRAICGLIPTNKGSKNFAVLQTSLTLCEDSLTMLRFYGKKNNIEGSGVNIVFKDSYFVDTLTPFFSPEYKHSFSTALDEDSNITKNITEKNDIEKKCMYWILYYDSKNNYLIFNPISKYEAQIIKLDTRVTKWNYIIPPKANASDTDLHHYYSLIGKNIKYAFKEMVKTINRILGKKNNQRSIEKIDDLLFYIKYLFKDEAFSDEQELRLMSISSMENLTMLDFHRKLYEDYVSISENGYNYIQKIIFGPNANECDITVEYYRHVAAISNKKIDIYKSHAPFSIVNNQGVEIKK